MNKELKPTFKISYSELAICLDFWLQDYTYRKHFENYRYGQHVCNWFNLNKMEGDNKKFEQLLWEIKGLTGVLEALEYYNIIDYNN